MRLCAARQAVKKPSGKMILLTEVYPSEAIHLINMDGRPAGVYFWQLAIDKQINPVVGKLVLLP